VNKKAFNYARDFFATVSIGFLATLPTPLRATDFDGVTGNLPELHLEHEKYDSVSVNTVSVVQLYDPSEMSQHTVTIDFDDAAQYDCVNTRYEVIEFQRDDGACVHAYDWASLGRSTTSPPMVMATISGPGAPTYVQHVNLYFKFDTFKVGTFIGNDQGNGMQWVLEVFDISGNSLGSVSLVSNGNTNVDEFLGLSSDKPFRKARISHNESWLAVGLDDVSFTPMATDIPTLSQWALLLLGILLAGGVWLTHTRRTRPL
jgi:hypothetical protein